MSSPLAALGKLEPESSSLNREATNVVALKSSANSAVDRFKSVALPATIGSYKYISDNRDHKLVDFLLIGILSVFVHNTVIDHFKGMSFEKEIIEAVKPPPKVQITLTRPQPKPVAPPPPPKVQPKPPPPKVVPLKPQKPKPVPKVVEQAPTPAPSPVVDTAPSAPAAAPAAPPAPPAPVVEKVTAPVAGADYGDRPDPIYPEHAQEMGWEGKVLLKVHVQASGKPAAVTVAKSSGHQELDDAAVKAVTKWTFKPAMRGDTPTDGFVTVPITFNI